jgi:hypothetical protein
LILAMRLVTPWRSHTPAQSMPRQNPTHVEMPWEWARCKLTCPQFTVTTSINCAVAGKHELARTTLTPCQGPRLRPPSASRRIGSTIKGGTSRRCGSPIYGAMVSRAVIMDKALTLGRR